MVSSHRKIFQRLLDFIIFTLLRLFTLCRNNTDWSCTRRPVCRWKNKNREESFRFPFIVEFVQLSRGVQVAAGESVFLRCLANKPVVQCEWSWRASNSSKEPLLIKKFSPNKDADHDCSVRFKNILYEEEGLWTCGVRLTPDGILHTAPAATVSLLPTGTATIILIKK